ncbi:MAG: hypothetical protein ACLQDY_21600 [Streptosporangiaceae bacterium]
MSCEHLICAQCAGPVAEGRCHTCRTARDHVHHSHPRLTAPLLAIMLIVLIAAMLMAQHLGH